MNERVYPIPSECNFRLTNEHTRSWRCWKMANTNWSVFYVMTREHTMGQFAPIRRMPGRYRVNHLLIACILANSSFAKVVHCAVWDNVQVWKHETFKPWRWGMRRTIINQLHINAVNWKGHQSRAAQWFSQGQSYLGSRQSCQGYSFLSKDWW